MGDRTAVPADISSVFQVMTSQKKLNEGKMCVHSVELTLDEVYHGCLKKVTFQRRKLLPDETVETEDRQLVIDVKPGLPDGTRFVFEGFESAQNVVSVISMQLNTGHNGHVHIPLAAPQEVLILRFHNSVGWNSQSKQISFVLMSKVYFTGQELLSMDV